VVILIIAVVLVAATLYWQRTRESRETSLEATPTAVGEQLEFDFTSAQVSDAIIQDADGNSVILERGEDGSWILVQPEAEMTDSQKVENALTQFLDPQTVSQISGQTPLSDLGLDPPAYRILLGLEDGSEEGVNIGKVTPTGSGYYVLVSGKGFFIIREFSLDQLLNLIIEPPVATPTATPTASSTPTP
jgi:hypothetical protein